MQGLSLSFHVNLLCCRLSPAYEAVVALDSVESLQNVDQAQLCRTASHALTDATRLEEAYQATQILSRLRLGTSSPFNNVTQVTIQSGLS